MSQKKTTPRKISGVVRENCGRGVRLMEKTALEVLNLAGQARSDI